MSNEQAGCWATCGWALQVRHSINPTLGPSKICVFLPAEADYVMAVQWDGKRYIMHRKKGSSGVDGRPDHSTGPGQYQAPKDSPKKKKKKK